MRSLLALTCLFGTASLAIPAARAEIDPNDFCLQGEWPFGPASELAVDPLRGLAFFQSGQRIVVVDASNPAQLQIVSDTIEPASAALDLYYETATNRLYIAAGLDGLEIWDVSDPAAPGFLGAAHPLYFGLTAAVKGVIATGGWAYVATDLRGVSWIDVSDPTNPIVDLWISPIPTLGTGGPDSSPDDLVFGDDGLIYLIGRNTSRLSIRPDGGLQDLYVIQGGGDDIFVADGVAYVIRNSLGLRTHDLDVDFPRLVSADEDSRWTTAVATKGNVGYFGMFSTVGLSIRDVSDPYNVVDIGTFPIPAPDAIQRVGDTLYLVNDLGLTTLDITNPTSPVLLDEIGTDGFYVDQVAVSGNYVISTGGDVNVLDISDAENPVPAGRYVPQGFANGLALDGNLLFVNEQTSNPATSAVAVLDVTDPANPSLKSRSTGVDQPIALVARNGFLFVAEAPIFPATTGGLRILDYSDPNNLAEVGYAALGADEEGSSLAVLGNYAYVGAIIFGAGTDGIRVVDISNPNQPQRLGFVPVPGTEFPKHLSADAGRLYAAVLADGLVTYDLSAPSNPVQAGWYHPVDYFAWRVVADGTRAYVAGSGIRVLDLSDPNQPQLLVTEPELKLFSVGLAVTDTQVIAAYGDAGARIFGTCGGLPGDLDGDGGVDLDDLTLLLQDFGCVGVGCSGDVDGDGDTDLDDLTLLLQNFGS